MAAPGKVIEGGVANLETLYDMVFGTVPEFG